MKSSWLWAQSQENSTVSFHWVSNLSSDSRSFLASVRKCSYFFFIFKEEESQFGAPWKKDCRFTNRVRVRVRDPNNANWVDPFFSRILWKGSIFFWFWYISSTTFHLLRVTLSRNETFCFNSKTVSLKIRTRA